MPLRSRWYGQAGVVALATLLATCTREPLTEPQFTITDAVHQQGNRNFFFLPPLVPNPSQSPFFRADAFDGTQRPTVAICLLAGSDCAVQQPSMFPVVFTMSPENGSEAIRMDPVAQQYIVNWHSGNYDLDPAQVYRIEVFVSGAPLGYADVDVVNNNGDLRNVNTGEYIPLLDGRTLPIKFRIQRGAIAFINVSEAIGVADAVQTLPPVELRVDEHVAVADNMTMLPPVTVRIAEAVTVSDQTRALPPALVQIAEAVAVSDQTRVLPPVSISIAERVSVTDADAVLPPVEISIEELVRISDQVRALPPVAVNVNEGIAISDHPTVLPPVNISIVEAIVVSDNVGVTPH